VVVVGVSSDSFLRKPSLLQSSLTSFSVASSATSIAFVKASMISFFIVVLFTCTSKPEGTC